VIQTLHKPLPQAFKESANPAPPHPGRHCGIPEKAVVLAEQDPVEGDQPLP
jgi:hypothetical protein